MARGPERPYACTVMLRTETLFGTVAAVDTDPSETPAVLPGREQVQPLQGCCNPCLEQTSWQSFAVQGCYWAEKTPNYAGQ